MMLSRTIGIIVLSLLISACYNRPPSGIGWAYTVGDPILHDFPYDPYYGGDYAHHY